MWVQRPTGTSRKPTLMTKNPSRVNNETQRRRIRIFSGELWSRIRHSSILQLKCSTIKLKNSMISFWQNDWLCKDDCSIKMAALFWKTWKRLVAGREGGGLGWLGWKGKHDWIFFCYLDLHHLFASHMHQQSDKTPCFEKAVSPWYSCWQLDTLRLRF